MIPLSALLLATVLLTLAFAAQSSRNPAQSSEEAGQSSEGFSTPYIVSEALGACKKARLGKSGAQYD
jgi:hypothetical protein